MSSNNGIKDNMIYCIGRRIMYLFMIDIYFLIAISPFLIYLIALGENLSIYMLAVLGILIGPAFSTILSVVSRLIKKEETSAKDDFIHFYKLNLIQGILAATVINIVLLLCYLDINYFIKQDKILISYIFAFIILFVLVVSLYVFPIISRIYARTKDVFKLSIELTFKKIYTTMKIILMLIITAFMIKILNLTVIVVLFGPIAIGYLIMIIQKNTLIEAEKALKNKYEDLVQVED